MRRIRRIAAFSASMLCACAGPIPSLTPLGEGPLSGVNRPVTERTPAIAHRPAVDPVKKSDRDDHQDPSDSELSNEQESKPEKETSDSEPKKEAKPAAADKTDKVDPKWEGEYAGEDVATYRFEGAPDRVQRDPNAKTRVQREGNKLRLTIIDSSNGKDLCTITAKVDGTTAAIDEGQECFASEEGLVRTRGVVKSGTVRLEGEKLIVEAELDFEFRAADRLREGRLTYRFEGKRK